MKKILLLLAGFLLSSASGAQAVEVCNEPSPCIATTAFEPVYENPAALAAANIPSLFDSVDIEYVVGSHAAPGNGTCGLHFHKGTSTPTGNYGEVLNTPSGVYWEPLYANSPVQACQFGAIADGGFTADYTTGAMTFTGNDNRPMLQAAIDYALQNGYNGVTIKGGSYTVHDTIQLGWGNGFYEIHLTSEDGARGAYNAQLGGVRLYSTKFDRPVLNVQGGRSVLIKGIGFLGFNYAYLAGFAAPAGGATYSDVNTWLYSGITPAGNNPGGLQTHSPYAAITIDAYKGAAPVDPYPAVNYPAWTGIVTQYNKSASSNISIEDCDIGGFGVAVVGSPNGDGNGDFINSTGVNVHHNVYGYAFANSQSRNNGLTNIVASNMHTVVTNKHFGQGQGQFTAPLINFHAGNSYQMFDVTMSFSASFGIVGGYSEATIRFGNIDATASYNNDLIIDGGRFAFDVSGVQNIIPPCFIHSNGANTNIFLRGVKLTTSGRIANLVCGAPRVTVEGGSVQGAYRYTTIGAGGEAGEPAAVNYSGGLLIGGGDPIARNSPSLLPTISIGGALTGAYINPTTNVWQTQRLADGVPFIISGVAVNRAPFTQTNKFFSDSWGTLWRFMRFPPSTLADLSSTTWAPVAPSFVDDILSFEYAAARQANPSSALRVGHILYHVPSGTIFVVTAVGAPTPDFPITARQQNNMLITSAGAYSGQLFTDTALTGTTVLINTDLILPRQVSFGDFTAANANVANVSRGDGYGGDTTTYYAANDWLYSFAMKDAYQPWPFAAAAGIQIQSVTNGSPGSMVLTGNAASTGRFPIYPLPIAN